MNSFSIQLIYAFLGGLIPALVWLWFWLREDLHPEPKRLLSKAFAAGVLAIPFALLAEALLYCGASYIFFTPHEASICASVKPVFGSSAARATLVLVISFAAVEEIIKYIAAKKYVLTGRDFDEPVDAMIYLITVALGFAAFENFFFLIPAFGNTFFEGITITNLRFLGATLLHAVSSGVVGYALALSFYQPALRKRYTAAGITAATGLHVIFNILVTKTGDGQAGLGQALAILALTSMFLIFAFDRVKKIKKAARFQPIPMPPQH